VTLNATITDTVSYNSIDRVSVAGMLQVVVSDNVARDRMTQPYASVHGTWY
jgi:hypothetical protein